MCLKQESASHGSSTPLQWLPSLLERKKDQNNKLMTWKCILANVMAWAKQFEKKEEIHKAISKYICMYMETLEGTYDSHYVAIWFYYLKAEGKEEEKEEEELEDLV